MWDKLKEVHEQLNLLDDQSHSLERRMLAFDKAIKEHMSALCISLNTRLKLANDMAKVMFEERKLDQMKTKQQTVNPLDAVLEATKHFK